MPHLVLNSQSPSYFYMLITELWLFFNCQYNIISCLQFCNKKKKKSARREKRQGKYVDAWLGRGAKFPGDHELTRHGLPSATEFHRIITRFPPMKPSFGALTQRETKRNRKWCSKKKKNQISYCFYFPLRT
jgi:hypothetical protein